MAVPYNIEIITPQGIALTAQVTHTLVPGWDGFVGVLANHAPYVTFSPGGRLEIRETSGAEKKYKAGPGFFEVAHNKASFLTQSLSAAG